MGGTAQTLSAVSGGGDVSNGTLTVVAPLSPAGEAVGVQNVANVALNGVLRVNVTADGACDQLSGTGDLSVAGLALEVVNSAALNRAQSYTVARCSGVLTGPFKASNLPADWHIRYNSASGAAVVFYAAPGTMIKVQ